jgi:hypothetical protein
VDARRPASEEEPPGGPSARWRPKPAPNPAVGGRADPRAVLGSRSPGTVGSVVSRTPGANRVPAGLVGGGLPPVAPCGAAPALSLVGTVELGREAPLAVVAAGLDDTVGSSGLGRRSTTCTCSGSRPMTCTVIGWGVRSVVGAERFEQSGHAHEPLEHFGALVVWDATPSASASLRGDCRACASGHAARVATPTTATMIGSISRLLVRPLARPLLHRPPARPPELVTASPTAAAPGCCAPAWRRPRVATTAP